jgi:UPF0716 family protein affecting phage T7 exclusion
MPLLILLFIVVPLVELYVIIQVGQAIGVLPTIGLLFLDSVLAPSCCGLRDGRCGCGSTRRSPRAASRRGRPSTVPW